MLKSEAEEKNMWTERLSSERDNTEEKKDEKDSSSPSPKNEKDFPPPLPISGPSPVRLHVVKRLFSFGESYGEVFSARGFN